MNLPVKYNANEFEVLPSANENNSNFLISWGAKPNESGQCPLEIGDFIDGIIIGFETNQYDKKNIILKSFHHNNMLVRVWGCSWIQRALHTDDTFSEMLYNPGNIIRVQFLGTYPGTKGKSLGKIIAKFKINPLFSKDFQLSKEDIRDIQSYQASLIQKQPLAAYKPMPQVAQPAAPQAYYIPQPNQHVQQQVEQPAPQQFKPFLKRARDDFDV